MSKLSNYNKDYSESTFRWLEGYGKLESKDRSVIADDIANGEDSIFEFREYRLASEEQYLPLVLSLEGGILNCAQPMPNNTEVKLSFDRALSSIGLLYREAPGGGRTVPTALDNKPLELVEPYLQVEYITSPYLRNFFAQIEDHPITMRYDDCQIYMKTIAVGQSSIRVNNIMGGLTPEYIFAGLIKTDALNGDFDLSSSCFDQNYIKDSCITLNGMAAQGYPISDHYLSDNSCMPVNMYSKFLDTIGKSKKSMAGNTIGLQQFATQYFFLSHRFEGEPTNEGWIGIDIKTHIPTTSDLTLGNIPI